MFFIITKIILYLIMPPASLLIIMAAGFIVIRRYRVAGNILIGGGVALLYLLSTGPVADLLLKPLEADSKPFKDGQVKADAIVVLGGGVADISWVGLPDDPSGTSLARLVKGIVLYRKLHLPVVLVGGNGDPSRGVTADADAMERIAREVGVPPKDLLVENKSRNTVEGARALGGLIKGRRIILVTSAYHMKRAARMFRKQGFDVIPAPTAYISAQREITPYSFIPNAGSLYSSSSACAEYISLSWYRLTGSI